MTRAGHVKIGAALVVLGVVLTAVSMHTDGGGVIYYGLILVGGYRILRGLAGGPDDESGLGRNEPSPPPRDDLRWHRSEGRQTVGQPCADCSQRFVTASEAVDCTHCDALLHAGGCLARHVAGRHGPHPPKPYR